MAHSSVFFSSVSRGMRAAAGSVVIVISMLAVRAPLAAAASCTSPSTDYGTVSGLSVSVTTAGTYRIWSRMSAPSATANTFLLEIDGSSCYNVGGSTVPVYASGATTYFAGDSSNWISKTATGVSIDVSLASGSHTLKLIGNAENVVVDRLIFTQDTMCVPSGDGSNCLVSTDTTPPVVLLTAPADNTSVAATTNAVANATDDVAVSKVEFYVDNILKSTVATGDASNNYFFALNPASFTTGSHLLKAVAYDAAGHNATSNTNTFIIGTTSTKLGDINKDGSVNYLDLSLLASKYGQSGAGIGTSDLNGDNTVNFLDLSILANNYGK